MTPEEIKDLGPEAPGADDENTNVADELDLVETEDDEILDPDELDGEEVVE